nr:RHS repeat-associated core domain-containing protein [Rhizobacter sp. SG703]
MAGGEIANERYYDLAGRAVRYPLGELLRDVRYDEASRIVSFTHLSASDGTAQPALDQAFGYDENSRLTSITTNAASWGIGYDANGNRTGISLNGSLSAYSVEATSNRTTSITNPARSFGYDSAGNTTTDSEGYTATYNLRGQLATLTKAGVTTSYTYNAAGQRVRKVSSTGAQSTVVFAYDQAGHVLGEYDQNGAALREYVWLRDTPMAMFTPDPANPTGAPLVFYIHTDHLNTPRVVVDRQNRVRWRWLAEPFGTTAPETDPSGLGVFTQNLRFPGQYADQESGLFYNYHRYYKAGEGRYTQSDPIGLVGGSVSTYGYVDGNPLTAVDPSGLFIVDENPPEGLSTYERQEWTRMVKSLKELGERFRARIKTVCFVDRAKLQTLFDDWVLRIDPNVFALRRNRSDFADTRYPNSTFYSRFFQEGDAYNSEAAPGQEFIFAHEFRHLSPSNRAKGSASLTAGNRLSGRGGFDPAEADADKFAELFLGRCPCGISN